MSGATGLEAGSGTHYIPRWSEVAVTLSIVAAGLAIFRMIAEYFPIFEAEEEELTAQVEQVEEEEVAGEAAIRSVKATSFQMYVRDYSGATLAAKLAICCDRQHYGTFQCLFGPLQPAFGAAFLAGASGADGEADHRSDCPQHPLRDAPQRQRCVGKHDPAGGQRIGDRPHPRAQQGWADCVFHRRRHGSAGGRAGPPKRRMPALPAITSSDSRRVSGCWG